ncbi:MAG: 50S ribosomal protein L13 [Chlorobi bacterium]|nr:MAG: 50S ribosomal protein L13 [Bacteroidota bacterium]KXK34206.1 MAG: 50S ribosomal protein L13 [Chlorobi bacterium OLB6]MBE2266258.1 50S ribosomal protein L13 [Flavobacteriales bacterium]MBL1161074.1 50S ribosomal protein L13 [Chlorobiota bacterium]MBW7854269.1 50S ribosomal protein L13 [Candidatus Kapabacteria bacterium]MCC6331018.1 50S ribosomal protein L13 [Ignavibacteria bacterium]
MSHNQKITNSLRKEDATHNWWVVDAAGQTVGRLATQVATLLRGKHKPDFTPHVDNGDFVVVINAEQIVMQGKRAEQKTYFHYTGYPGGGRVRTFKDLKENKPEEIVELAVRGMLPKTSLGRAIGKKLKVYRSSEHPHEAQQPKPFALKA